MEKFMEVLVIFSAIYSAILGIFLILKFIKIRKMLKSSETILEDPQIIILNDIQHTNKNRIMEINYMVIKFSNELGNIPDNYVNHLNSDVMKKAFTYR